MKFRLTSCDFGVFWPSEGHWGGNRHPDPQKTGRGQITHSILEVILESFWSPGGIKNRSDFLMFFEGTFGRLLAHLGGQRAPKEGHLEPFWRTFGQQAEM